MATDMQTDRRTDYSANSATVAVFGDSRRIRQQSPVLATVTELGDYSRQWGQAIKLLEPRNIGLQGAA